jgi:tetratricopeptide (TPR) repeat protein
VDALASYDKAIALKPDYAEAHCIRGTVLKELKRYVDALASYDKAIALKPDYAEAYNDRGTALRDLKRLDEALVSCDKAITLKPDYAEAYLNKSLGLLCRGEFGEGWELYEWRWKIEKTTSKPLLTDKPAFNLKDWKRVLVWAEQGVGDEIMFGSMISEFRHSCTQLIVQVDARLISLFSRSISNDVVFLPRKSLIPQERYDQQISMGSLGRYLRNDEASFYKSRFGYLKADSGKTNEIKKFLTIDNRRKFCGISWRSKNEKTGDSRSIKLNDFLEFVSMNDYSFVNLQYGETDAEIKQARAELGIDVINYDKVDNFNDLDGLACLIQACDVVVSVDNATVHLAGALGKDVRILLPRASEWRWQLDRDDSPWYASAKLYRQSDDGDWASTFAKIRTDLQIA